MWRGPAQVVTLEADFARIGVVKTGDAVDEAGLACSVGTNYRDQLTLGDLEGSLVERSHSAKTQTHLSTNKLY